MPMVSPHVPSLNLSTAVGIASGFPVMPLPFMMVMSAGAVITGLVVARLHRGHEMSMVFAFTGALLLFYTFGFFNSLATGLQTFRGMYGLAVNSLFPFILGRGHSPFTEHARELTVARRASPECQSRIRGAPPYRAWP